MTKVEAKSIKELIEQAKTDHRWARHPRFCPKALIDSQWLKCRCEADRINLALDQINDHVGRILRFLRGLEEGVWQSQKDRPQLNDLIALIERPLSQTQEESE